MNPKERNPLYLHRIFSHRVQREKIGGSWQPSKREVFKIINELYPPIKTKMIEYPNTNPDDIVRVLNDIRFKLTTEPDGIPPSKPLLVASTVLHNTAYKFQDYADIAIQRRDRLPFVFYHDVSFGIRHTLETIEIAEDTMRKGIDDSSSESEANEFFESVGVNIPVADQAERQMRMLTDSTDAVSLLKEDPTGYLLVEEAAKRLKGESSRFRNPDTMPFGYVPDFVAIGEI